MDTTLLLSGKSFAQPRSSLPTCTHVHPLNFRGSSVHSSVVSTLTLLAVSTDTELVHNISCMHDQPRECKVCQTLKVPKLVSTTGGTQLVFQWLVQHALHVHLTCCLPEDRLSGPQLLRTLLPHHGQHVVQLCADRADLLVLVGVAHLRHVPGGSQLQQILQKTVDGNTVSDKLQRCHRWAR